MREIKFRAWNTVTKTMIDLKKLTPLALNMDTDGLFIPFSDGLPIMQFTGFKDKTGKEIYEGDILRVTGEAYFSTDTFSIGHREDGEWSFSGQVEMSSSGYWMIVDDESSLIPFFEAESEDLDIEVIGNIHEAMTGAQV